MTPCWWQVSARRWAYWDALQRAPGLELRQDCGALNEGALNHTELYRQFMKLLEKMVRVPEKTANSDGPSEKLGGALALGPRTQRRHADGLPELTYPFHDRDILVTACGRS
jgi:hypothetical protein